MRLSRVLLWCLAGAVVIAIGIPLMLMFSPVMIRIDPELLITTGIIVILFVTAALGCAIVMERGRAGRWMQSGVIASIIGGAGWTALFLLNDHITEWLWLVLLTWPTCWAGLMLVVGILLLPANREGWWRWLRRVTIMLTALLAAHICLATSLHPELSYGHGRLWMHVISQPTLWIVVVLIGAAAFLFRRLGWRTLLTGLATALALAFLVHAMYWGAHWPREDALPADWDLRWELIRRYEDAVFRVGAILAILAGGGAFTTLLTIWIPGLTGRPQPDALPHNFGLCCPRCGHQQIARTGEYNCRQCGLSIKVDLL